MNVSLGFDSQYIYMCKYIIYMYRSLEIYWWSTVASMSSQSNAPTRSTYRSSDLMSCICGGAVPSEPSRVHIPECVVHDDPDSAVGRTDQPKCQSLRHREQLTICGIENESRHAGVDGDAVVTKNDDIVESRGARWKKRLFLRKAFCDPSFKRLFMVYESLLS